MVLKITANVCVCLPVYLVPFQYCLYNKLSECTISVYKRLQSISKRILNSGVNKSLAAGRSRGVTTLLPTKLTKDSYKHKFGVEESWQYPVAVSCSS